MGYGDFSGRINIKYLYISNYTEKSAKRCSIQDIAIVTEDLKYVEYEIRTHKLAVTPFTQSPYHSLMSDWQLTPMSRIYYHENVVRNEPVRMLLKAMAQQFKIRQYIVHTDQMVRRLCHIHANFLNKRDKKTGRYIIKKTGKKYFLQQVWRKVVKTGLCPWITKEYDAYLTAKGYKEIKYRKQLLRLGMYYIHESNIKTGYDRAAKERRRKKLEAVACITPPADSPTCTANTVARRTQPVSAEIYAETEECRTGIFS